VLEGDGGFTRRESMVILKDELIGLLISAYRRSLGWWYRQ
jgi:hypothetical protein